MALNSPMLASTLNIISTISALLLRLGKPSCRSLSGITSIALNPPLGAISPSFIKLLMGYVADFRRCLLALGRGCDFIL